MKAKKVFNTIEKAPGGYYAQGQESYIPESMNFKRGGGSATKSLGVGVYKEINDILSELYPGEHSYQRTFTVVSKDFIIIRYNPELINLLITNQEKDELEIAIIKYSTIDPYVVDKHERGGLSMYDKSRYKFICVFERSFNLAGNPDHMKVKSTVLVDLDIKEPQGKEKCEIMANALNTEFGQISGFEFVKELTVPAEKYENKIKELIAANS